MVKQPYHRPAKVPLYPGFKLDQICASALDNQISIYKERGHRGNYANHFKRLAEKHCEHTT